MKTKQTVPLTKEKTISKINVKKVSANVMKSKRLRELLKYLGDK